jgi:predicted glycoside hydrolase/deacetylase ChbG (UPF0249 family)
MNGIFRDNLIISADDFGMNSVVNENILGLLRVGKLDRVSVMMGGKISKREIRELLESEVKLDLHLSLGYFSEWKGKNDLKKNALSRVLVFLADYFSGKNGKFETIKSWEKQVLEFQKTFGKFPDGLNSHEHLHFFPPYFRIISRLAKKYHITYLRFGRFGLVRAKYADSMVAFILDRLWRFNLSYFKKNFTPTSDFLLSFDWMKNPAGFLDIISDKVKVEVVFHPERAEEKSFILRNL